MTAPGVARDETRLESVAAELHAAHGIHVETLRADLAVRADVPTLSASFAFSAVFALGPLLSLALTALSTLRDDTFRSGLEHLARAIVPSVSAPFLDVIAGQVKRAGNPLVLVVSLLGLVWTLSSASDAEHLLARGHIRGGPLLACPEELRRAEREGDRRVAVSLLDEEGNPQREPVTLRGVEGIATQAPPPGWSGLRARPTSAGASTARCSTAGTVRARRSR